MPQSGAMNLSAMAYLVPDYDVGIAFFTALGWVLAEDIPMGDKRWVTVTPPDGGLRIVLARAAGAQAAMIGQQGAGRVWLFLRTDDFDAAARRVQAAGGVFEESPRLEPYGKVAVWRDPFGNRWDLIQPAT